MTPDELVARPHDAAATHHEDGGEADDTETINEEVSRSPPGQWRLLTAALPTWALTAWAITSPGTGGIIAICSGVAGIILLSWLIFLLVVAHRQKTSIGSKHPPQHRFARLSAGRVTGASTIAFSLLMLPLAALVLVGSQTSALERTRADPSLRDAAATGVSVNFTASLAGFPESRTTEFGERAWVRAHAMSPSGDVPLLLWLDDPAQIPHHWAPGTHVDTRARLQPQPAGDPAAYTATLTELTQSSVQPSLAHLGAVAARFRQGLHEQALRVAGAQLVPGLSVGDTSLVSVTLEEAMLKSSLSHVTAVSGSNTGLAIAAAIWCASRLGAGRRVRIVVGALALLAFVGIVGPDASVQRAAVMAGVLLIGRFGGRRAAALPALGLAVIVLLAFDPWQALQPGFALSVAATGGILILASPLAHWLHQRLHAPRWLALPFAVAISAQLACGPLLLLLQSGIPAIGVIANVMAAPAVPLGTGLGLLVALVDPVAPSFAGGIMQLAALPASWIAAVSQVCAAVPAGRWNWPGGWGGALLLAVCESLIALVWGVSRGHLTLPRLFGSSRPSRAPWHRSPEYPPALRTTLAVLFAASLGTIVAFTVVIPVARVASTPKNWAVVACDVGQGDALLLRDPEAPHTIMLVDTGDDPDKLQACLARFGVKRISLVVLSHDDRDHIGALSAVLDRVDTALIAPATIGETHAKRQVVSQLEQAAIPFRVGIAGDSSDGSAGLSWRVLAPSGARSPNDTNSASLVMMVNAGPIRVLLLGDTGYDEQAALLRSLPDPTVLSADVVKVAHHGSRDQDAALPAAVTAEWALVSVGADNRYGHPAAETLDDLVRAGSRVLRTDLHGTLALMPQTDGAITVWAMRSDA